MDTQKILKKRDKKLKKHKKEKREKHISESSDEEKIVQPPVENISESSEEESDHDQRDATDIKKLSIVAEPGHSAAEAEVKAESKYRLRH